MCLEPRVYSQGNDEAIKSQSNYHKAKVTRLVSWCPFGECSLIQVGNLTLQVGKRKGRGTKQSWVWIPVLPFLR